MSNHEYIQAVEDERDRFRQQVRTLTVAIERYADTLILDQPLDGTAPLNRSVVAHDLRAFLNFAANGGIISHPAEEPSGGHATQDKLAYLSMTCANPSDHLSAGLWCSGCRSWVPVIY
jgi:hypothetical protein